MFLLLKLLNHWFHHSLNISREYHTCSHPAILILALLWFGSYIQTGVEPQQFPLPGFMCSAPAPLQIFLCLHSLPFDLGSKENSKGSDFFKILLLVPSKITQFCSPLCIAHILSETFQCCSTKHQNCSQIRRSCIILYRTKVSCWNKWKLDHMQLVSCQFWCKYLKIFFSCLWYSCV